MNRRSQSLTSSDWRSSPANSRIPTNPVRGTSRSAGVCRAILASEPRLDTLDRRTRRKPLALDPGQLLQTSCSTCPSTKSHVQLNPPLLHLVINGLPHPARPPCPDQLLDLDSLLGDTDHLINALAAVLQVLTTLAQPVCLVVYEQVTMSSAFSTHKVRTLIVTCRSFPDDFYLDRVLVGAEIVVICNAWLDEQVVARLPLQLGRADRMPVPVAPENVRTPAPAFAPSLHRRDTRVRFGVPGRDRFVASRAH